MSKVIAIDFDGCIVVDRYPVIGDLMPYARYSMQRIHELGHKIVINTCRTNEEAFAAYRFLKANDIPIDAFNCNVLDGVQRYGSDTRKISADLYIEDKVLGGFPGWLDVMVWVHENTSPANAQRAVDTYTEVSTAFLSDDKQVKEDHGTLPVST